MFSPKINLDPRTGRNLSTRTITKHARRVVHGIESVVVVFGFVFLCFMILSLLYKCVYIKKKDKLNNYVKKNVCNLKCFIMINCLEFPLGLSSGHAHRFLLQETVE